jgi:hypothetical protein
LKVVATLEPFTSTAEAVTNPEPFTVMTVSGEPEATVEGEMVVTESGVGVGVGGGGVGVGTGVGVGVATNALLPPPQPIVPKLRSTATNALDSINNDLVFVE